MPPDGKLHITYEGMGHEQRKEEGLEISLCDCSIPRITLEERGFHTGWHTWGDDTVPGKTLIHLEGNVKTELRTSAGINSGVSSAEIRNVPKGFIAKTKQQITINVIESALWDIQNMENVTEGGSPAPRPDNRNLKEVKSRADTKITADNFSMGMAIRDDQDITFISKDKTETLNVKSFAQAERQKHGGKSKEELSVLLQQHERDAAKTDGPSR
jgi:hypothetical protein